MVLNSLYLPDKAVYTCRVTCCHGTSLIEMPIFQPHSWNLWFMLCIFPCESIGIFWGQTTILEVNHFIHQVLCALKCSLLQTKTQDVQQCSTILDTWNEVFEILSGNLLCFKTIYNLQSINTYIYIYIYTWKLHQYISRVHRTLSLRTFHCVVCFRQSKCEV